MKIIKNVDDFLKPEFKFAILGINNNREKYAFWLFLEMLEKKLVVFPISSEETKIQDQPAFPNFKLCPQFPDVIIFAFEKKVSDENYLNFLREMRDVGIKKAIFLPDQVTKVIKVFCQMNFIEFTIIDLRKILGDKIL